VAEGITIIIPTIGRETLEQAIGSFIEQMSDRDKAVVIHDGHDEEAQEISARIVLQFDDRRFRYLATTHQGHFGHPSRNIVLSSHARTSHVWSLDDDDVATPNALAVMREHFDDPWTIFRMHFGANHFANGLTLPSFPRIRHGNLGTPMIFAPRCNARFGHNYSGDFDYAEELQTELGEPVWSDDIVATIRP